MNGILKKPGREGDKDNRHQPPDKRRRLETLGVGDMDQFWDDDDDGKFEFTQADLAHIDDMIAGSQMPSANDITKNQTHTDKMFSGKRAIGKNTGRSLSANALGSQSKPHSSGNSYMARKNAVCEVIARPGLGGDRVLGKGTPVAGSTGSGKISPGLPSSGQVQVKTHADRLQDQCTSLQQEIKKLREEQFSKDGQIQILRENLSVKDTELRLHKQDKLKRIEQDNREWSEREKQLDTQVERLTTELQFKEKELRDMEAAYKKMEREKDTAMTLSQSVAQEPVKKCSPMKVTVPSPKQAFPSTSSFLATSPVKKSSQPSPRKCQPEKPEVIRRQRKTQPLQTKLSKDGLGHNKLLHTLTMTQIGNNTACDASQSFTSLLAKLGGLLSSPGCQSSSVIHSDHVYLAQRAIEQIISSPQPDPTPCLNLLPFITDCLTAFINKSDPNNQNESMDLDNQRLSVVDLEQAAVCSMDALRGIIKCTPSVQTAICASGDGNSLFYKIIHSAWPSINKKDKGGSYSLHEICAEVLLILIESSEPQDLNCFQSVVTSTQMCSYLSQTSPPFLLSSLTLSILTALVKSSTLLALFCTAHEGSCVWSAVYQLVTSSMKSFSPHQQATLATQVVEMVGQVVSHHTVSALETKCQCSNMHVRSLVTILHKESLHTSHSDVQSVLTPQTTPFLAPPPITMATTKAPPTSQAPPTAQSNLLRRGLHLLHTLSLHDLSFHTHYQQVELLYIELLSNMDTDPCKSHLTPMEARILQDLCGLHIDGIEGTDEPDAAPPQSTDHKMALTKPEDEIPEIVEIEPKTPNNNKRRGNRLKTSRKMKTT